LKAGQAFLKGQELALSLAFRADLFPFFADPIAFSVAFCADHIEPLAVDLTSAPAAFAGVPGIPAAPLKG
jgi:hypothetical protein